MYHSMTFGDKNTWDDWHLIPASRPVFSMPSPEVRLVSIPGKAGTLDITELMGRQILYGDRSGSFSFYVENGYWNSWAEAYQTIANYLHGQRMTVWLEDDPDYYYEGRFSVSEWRSDQTHSSIVINYNVAPYKRSRYIYGDDWLWDTFNFEEDTIPDLKNITVTESGYTLKIEGFGYRTIPVITASTANMRLIFDGGSPIQLNYGENKPSGAIITRGVHTLKFVGTGTISIEYRGGSL